MIDKEYIHYPWGPIIAGVIMVGIIFLIFLSLTGEPEYIQDPYDGSSRSVFP